MTNLGYVNQVYNIQRATSQTVNVFNTPNDANTKISIISLK